MTRTIAAASGFLLLLLLLMMMIIIIILMMMMVLVPVVVRQSTQTLFSTSPIILTTTMAFSIQTRPMSSLSWNKNMCFISLQHSIPRFQQSSLLRKISSNQIYNTARNLSVKRTTGNYYRNDFSLFQPVVVGGGVYYLRRIGTLITTHRRRRYRQNNIIQNLQASTTTTTTTTTNDDDDDDDTEGQQSVSTYIRSSSHNNNNNNNDTTYCYYDTKLDEEFLQMAVDAAQLGYGYTFPNPAVGCIIVLSTTTTTTTTTNLNNQPKVNHTIIGRGYHPRTGYPHAEIFALLEAAKHVPCGIQAATSVIQHYNLNLNNKRDDGLLGYDNKEQQGQQLYEAVVSLTKQYQGVNGTRILFENCLQPYLLDESSSSSSSTTTKTITAYVTLEPCCHLGKRTPPCTNSLLVSNGISRIVVGSRDPNPQVDGSGIQILQQQQQQQSNHDDHSQHSTKISIVDIPQSYYSTPGTAPYNCNILITNFAKRITVPTPDYELIMTGKMKRVLRTFASQIRNNHSSINNSILPTVSWGSYTGLINDQNDNNTIVNFSAASIDMDELLIRSNVNTNPGVETNKNELIEKAVNDLDILPNWLEHLDGILWQHELVVLRLNKAISKRKGTTILGNRIAQQLKACVVQTKGHTVLLYRPSSETNPIIDVQNLLMNDDGNDANADDEENDS